MWQKFIQVCHHYHFQKSSSTLKWSALPVTSAETTPKMSGLSDSSSWKQRVCVCVCVCVHVCVSDTSEGGFEEESETLKPHHLPSSFCKNLSIFL